MYLPETLDLLAVPLPDPLLLLIPDPLLGLFLLLRPPRLLPPRLLLEFPLPLLPLLLKPLPLLNLFELNEVFVDLAGQAFGEDPHNFSFTQFLTAGSAFWPRVGLGVQPLGRIHVPPVLDVAALETGLATAASEHHHSVEFAVLPHLNEVHELYEHRVSVHEFLKNTRHAQVRSEVRLVI